MSRHRARARRNLRFAQISALGLVALAGLLAAMPPPRVVVPAAATPPPVLGENNDPNARSLDLAAAATVLQTRVHKTEPKPKDNATEPEPGPDVAAAPDDESLPPPVQPGGPPHFNFIGMASSPRGSYAFVSDPEGRSRTVAQGEYFDALKEYYVLGISSERMILTNCDDERHEYLIAERPENPNLEAAVDLMGAKNVTTGINPNTVAPVGTNGIPPMPTPANMSDPQDRERFQREMEERRSLIQKGTAYQPPNQPAAPPGRPTPATPPRPGVPASKNAANNSNVK